jgi:hypothetical protein
MDKIEGITTERGNDYGLPIDQFDTTRKMFDLWESRREGGKEIPEELNNVLKHIAYLVMDKLVRCGENPLKQDNYDDIQGYASLWEKSVHEYNRRNDEAITPE